MGSIGNTVSIPVRPITRNDYKLNSSDITTLRVLFEGHETGVGAGLARKFSRAEQEGRTNVSMTFQEKDFAGYKLEGMLTDDQAIALEKAFKAPYKEMFDEYWKERRRK